MIAASATTTAAAPPPPPPTTTTTTTITAVVAAAHHQHHSTCAESLWICNIRTYTSVNSVDKCVAQHNFHSNTKP